MAECHATYSTKSWDRKPWGGEHAAEGKEVVLGRVEMVHVYEGDIEGEATLQYLMAYNTEFEGGFVGLEKVIGKVGGKRGSFVFQCTGTAADGRMKQVLVVLPGSGTGELCNLRGQATMECDLHLEQYPIRFEYEL